ncbi:MAG: ComF family protein [Eubacterium sp.]|nr:ComF family protein [Eubacterium sp.]
MIRVLSFIRTQKRKWKKSLKAFLHSEKYIHYSFRLRESLLPLLFPRHCPACGKLLPGGVLICDKCRRSLPWIKEPACFQCGKPVGSPEQELCYDCRQFPKSFSRGISLLLYNEQTRPIMTNFKYHNRRILSGYFAGEICQRYHDRLLTWKPGLIIPIPVHRKKLKRRGYNQAALLARDLSALTKIPYCSDLLFRNTDTAPQKNLSPQARLNNLKDAFSMNPDYRYLPTTCPDVLLIDDIYTTGATMETCSRVLLKAGFRRIYVCTVCAGVSRD